MFKISVPGAIIVVYVEKWIGCETEHVNNSSRLGLSGFTHTL
jgi:hypothetical protein